MVLIICTAGFVRPKTRAARIIRFTRITFPRRLKSALIPKTTALYLPVGAGAGGFVLKTRPAQGEETRGEKWNLALYAGVGMEVDISPVVFLGAEYRYIYSFVQESDVDFADGSNRYFQSHVFMFKIGMRLF